MLRCVMSIALVVLAIGCNHNEEVHNSVSGTETKAAMQLNMVSGQIVISNLPPHRGLTLSIAFFKVEDPGSDPPFGGDPPSDAVTDCSEVINDVDLDSEVVDSSRTIPFSINHAPGHFYIQIRTILYRKHNGKMFAQAEQFFFGRRPLPLLHDLPSVTLPVAWPSIPIEDLESYGTIKPQGSN